MDICVILGIIGVCVAVEIILTTISSSTKEVSPKNTPFIVFEGIDNSGKTTLSKRIAQKYKKFTWTKEPIFSTEQADRLNSPTSSLSDAEREVIFLEGRLERQTLYNTKPCLLDRYLWTGLAYAKAFSPSIFEFCTALYQNYHIFRKPTVIFFMETPIETCRSREPGNAELTLERLQTLRDAYRDTAHMVHCPIVYVDGTQSIEACEKFVCDYIETHIFHKKK